MRARKKPVEVEVQHFTEIKTAPPQVCTCKDGAHLGTHVHTLEGMLSIRLGDWVVRGVAGEFYPVKASIFDQTYDLMAAPPFVIFFDTETAGLPQNYKAPPSAGPNWPRMVQLAWEVHDADGVLILKRDAIIKPVGFTIPAEAAAIHGITQERALAEGRPLAEVLGEFLTDAAQVKAAAGHNVIGFDKSVVLSEMMRASMATAWPGPAVEWLDTMTAGTNVCKIPGRYGFKWPKLDELYRHLFAESFAEAHNAAADIKATARCFWEMVRLGAIKFKAKASA